jgi:hypothetical protein
MKIFMGVMQSDILKQDVGIGNLDPRRLAEGADEKTIYLRRAATVLARAPQRTHLSFLPQLHAKRAARLR